jgi:tRNA threonylcarbamoyl adenosine modification protein YjeE
MSKELVTHPLSLDRLGLFAEAVARLISPPISLGLIGEMGAGKTTFIRELVKHLGSSDPVSSPTFVLQHEYVAKKCVVEHWDLYRLGHEPDELQEPPASRTIRLVEWAQYAEKHTIDAFFEFILLDALSRQLVVTGSLVESLGLCYPDLFRSTSSLA